MSEESFRICGFDPQEGVPAREEFFERIHEEDRHRVYEHVEKALRQGKDFSDEFRIVVFHFTLPAAVEAQAA